MKPGKRDHPVIALYANEIILFKKENEEKEIADIPVKVADFIIHDIINDEIRFDNELCQKIFDEISSSLDQELIRDKDFFFSVSRERHCCFGHRPLYGTLFTEPQLEKE